MASSISTGSAASTPDPQAMTAVVQPTMPSKATPAPAFKLSHQSRDTASHLGSATDTKLNLDDFQLEAWLAVDLEPPNSCNSDRLLNHMLSLRVPDGLGIDNDLLLDRCLKGVLPIRHLEEVINYIKTYCAETSSNAGRDRYAPNDPSLDNVAVRAVAGVHHNMPNDCDLAPIIGLSWYDGIERTGTLSFLGINLCHADSWAPSKPLKARRKPSTAIGMSSFRMRLGNLSGPSPSIYARCYISHMRRARVSHKTTGKTPAFIPS
ncbi:hypothetical protein OF83DRAFT_1295438 [Amylostereum chailletii]|nr:hypothetical protein OF83DRAFT_1295438 [Amylostereum chailletii]